ncbi:MAG: hypothetical protein A07HR67_01249 [uncultured archaeon A07HR67]|nr:MAG: hypothetical protein A07HR67_01249 [uncultured archaeon A07HR67]
MLRRAVDVAVGDITGLGTVAGTAYVAASYGLGVTAAGAGLLAGQRW